MTTTARNAASDPDADPDPDDGAALAELAVPVAPEVLPAADLDLAAKHMALALEALGFDLARDGVADTPARFVRAVDELAGGRLVDPRRHLEVTFPSEGGGMVTTRGIPITSLCEHHLLPFDGLAVVSYLPAPDARIFGLSKLARVAQDFAARWTVQERVTRQIADAVTECGDVLGVGVVIVSDHSCMSLRGARAHGADTVTEAWRGRYVDEPALQQSVMRLALG